LLCLTACGGSDKPAALSVRWEASQGGPVHVNISDESPGVHQTYVYVHNGATPLRDARLRLRNVDSSSLGLGVGGTVTRAPTHIEGQDQVWELGDLEPGSSLRFPLGLWFDVSPQLESANGVSLKLELLSPDLQTPVESTKLLVSVTRGQ